MKTKLILLILMIFAIAHTGHTQKQEKFYNQDGEEISEKKLLKIQRKKYREVIYGLKETENTIETRLFKRRIQGKLSQDEKESLIKFVENIIASKIPENYITIILFYPGKDECNSTGRATPEFFRNKYNNYKAKVLESGEIIQFNIYKSEEGLEKYSLDRKWYADTNQTFEKIFFEYDYPCSSYVVFDTKGNYMGFLGEYDTNMSIEDANKLKALK